MTGKWKRHAFRIARSCFEGWGLWAMRSISSSPGFREAPSRRRSGTRLAFGSGVAVLGISVVLYEAGFVAHAIRLRRVGAVRTASDCGELRDRKYDFLLIYGRFWTRFVNRISQLPQPICSFVESLLNSDLGHTLSSCNLTEGHILNNVLLDHFAMRGR